MFRVLWTPTVLTWALLRAGLTGDGWALAVMALAVVLALFPRRLTINRTKIADFIGRAQDACARMGWVKLHDWLADLCKLTTGDFARWYGN